ncbi:F-box protein At1g47056 [Selaginella moellendorffii]|nr:F-box protein At1g47056 [Selaginella moellendorffii]|eukprot:XP_002969264.2 F-box protein At1g47056 [Selaginella moellendorffii]
MGQAGSSIACTYIEESEHDYLLQIPSRHHGQFEQAKFGKFLLQQQEHQLLQQQQLQQHRHRALDLLELESQDGEEEEEEWVEQEDLTLLVPDECLEWILHKLSPGDRTQSSLVCRRWHRLEGRSRTQLSLAAHADVMPFLPRICSRFVQLTKITLKCDRRDPSINDRALVLISKHCKGLVKLKLKGCKDVTDEGIDHFSRVARSLKKFSCGSCGFGPLGLNCLLQRCADLESLAVKRLRGISQAFPELLISPGCGRIRKLCLKELRNARLFGPLIIGSPNLQVLRLSKNLGHWDKLLEAITEHLPHLLELHVERLQLSDRGLQAVAQCKSLEALYVVKASECTNFGLSAVAFGCRHLKRLRLDGWRSGRIGDEGLISIAKRCRELQELVLIRLSISVGSLTIIGSNCASLERLAVCNCESFGDAELCCIATRFRALRKLCIRSCSITNLGVEGLGNGCPALTRLKVRNCNQVTSEGIGNLRVRLMRPVWISLLNDVMPVPLSVLPAVAEGEITAHNATASANHSTQGVVNHSGSNRIHRAFQGSSQMMKSKLNWATGNAAAVSCYCAKP